MTIDASRTLGGFLQPSHRPDRSPVDIERLTPKRHRFFDVSPRRMKTRLSGRVSLTPNLSQRERGTRSAFVAFSR